jgi:hypothetical protein
MAQGADLKSLTHESRRADRRISERLGCPAVTLAMDGPPALELCCSFLAGFLVRRYYCTSLWVALCMDDVAACWCFEFAATPPSVENT